MTLIHLVNGNIDAQQNGYNRKAVGRASALARPLDVDIDAGTRSFEVMAQVPGNYSGTLTLSIGPNVE
jgi:hypothetical protein